MLFIKKNIKTLIVVLFLFMPVVTHAQQTAQRLYSVFEPSVYRVEVVTPGTQNKASIGTGFVFGRSDMLASNFHVVSSVVHEPERYQLEWVSADGRRGPLSIVAIDVVNDLSLLKATESLGQPMVTTGLPDKGSDLYSMGHPLALELAIVPGSANGLLDNSLHEKIHFSGNINPGMSGGPTLDSEGRVVGINVATSGEAVSYLVPAGFLDEMLARADARDFMPEESMTGSIHEQLLASQDRLMNEMLNGDWSTVRNGKFNVPGKVFGRLDCWSNNQFEDEQNRLSMVSSVCRGQDSIFLSDRLRAGSISYEFFWLESESLSPAAFYTLYNSRHDSVFINGASEEDVGNFSCSTRFVEVSGQNFKANVCARPYLQYPELTDFMVLMALTGHEREGLIVTLDLASVTLENGLAVFEKMLENMTWNP